MRRHGPWVASLLLAVPPVIIGLAVLPKGQAIPWTGRYFVAAYLIAAVSALLFWRAAVVTVPLRDRAIAIANKVRRCDKRQVLLPPYEAHSAYDDQGHHSVSAARLIVRMHRQPVRLRRLLRRLRRRRYTARLHRQVQAMIEELATVGKRDAHLQPFLSRRPRRAEYEDLARQIWWLAAGMPADAG